MVNTKRMLARNLTLMALYIGFGICCFVFHKVQPLFISFAISGIIVISMNLFRIKKMTHNEEFRKQIEIESQDERSLMINAKTAEIAGFILAVVCSVGALISMLVEKTDYLFIFAGLLLFFGITYLIIKAVLNKIY